MRRSVILTILLFPFLLLFYIWFGDSLKYPNEIKLAYDYVNPISQKTIKNWKVARVMESTPTADLEIMSKETNSLINIKGRKVLVVKFKTEEDEILGSILVYIDKNTNNVLGIGGRK